MSIGKSHRESSAGSVGSRQRKAGEGGSNRARNDEKWRGEKTTARRASSFFDIDNGDERRRGWFSSVEATRAERISTGWKQSKLLSDI
ncbi:hypothetical protein Dimus_024286 [Dionaea muscipula]